MLKENEISINSGSNVFWGEGWPQPVLAHRLAFKKVKDLNFGVKK